MSTRVRPTGDLYHRVIPAGAVYVGRSTPWGNPHPVGKPCKACAGATHERAEAIALYREHLAARPDLVDRARRELTGLNLACWCKPDQPCHGDVLLAVIARRQPNARTLGEVRAEALDWFWREVSFLDPTDEVVIAELSELLPPDKDLARASVMEIQGWAVRLAKANGARSDAEACNEQIAELAALDGGDWHV